MIGAVLICTVLRSSSTPSALMIHEIDSTVKIWPGCGRDEEPAEKAILFDKETARTPLPGAPTVDRISSAVLRGVSHEGRLIDRETCVIKNKKTTETHELYRFRPSVRHNTLLLWSVDLH